MGLTKGRAPGWGRGRKSLHPDPLHWPQLLTEPSTAEHGQHALFHGTDTWPCLLPLRVSPGPQLYRWPSPVCAGSPAQPSPGRQPPARPGAPHARCGDQTQPLPGCVGTRAPRVRGLGGACSSALLLGQGLKLWDLRDAQLGLGWCVSAGCLWVFSKDSKAREMGGPRLGPGCRADSRGTGWGVRGRGFRA